MQLAFRHKSGPLGKKLSTDEPRTNPRRQQDSSYRRCTPGIAAEPTSLRFRRISPRTPFPANFRLADNSGIGLSMTTSAFIGTYLVELPTTRLSGPDKFPSTARFTHD